MNLTHFEVEVEVESDARSDQEERIRLFNFWWEVNIRWLVSTFFHNFFAHFLDNYRMRLFAFGLIVLAFANVATAFSHRQSVVRHNVIAQRSMQLLPSKALFSKDGAKEEEIEERQLSSTMKDKLMKEIQNNAGDPNFSQGPVLGNPILIISVVISVLAIALKGKGYM